MSKRVIVFGTATEQALVRTIEELKRKNAALRERLDSVQKSHFTLSKDNAELRKDKERLDWLDHNAIPWTWMSPEKIDGLGPIVVTWKSNRTLRSAIDTARKEAQP